MNLTLENDSPASLVSVLQVFISVLRNKPNTKPVDVELFFSDYDKLRAKMGRIESTDCDFALVDSNLVKIEQIQKGAYDSAAMQPFQCYMDWTINFLKAAQIDLKMVRLLAEQEEIKLKLQRAQLKLSRFDQMEEHSRTYAFQDYFNRSVQMLDQRAQNFGNIVDTDEQQAVEYQKELKAFNNAYFKEMMDIYKNK